MTNASRLIDEIHRAESCIERYARFYRAQEADCPAEFKMVMFFNGWHSPFVALNELLKVIDKDEMLIKRVKKNGEPVTYKSRYKEMRLFLQKEVNKHGRTE